MPKLTSYNSGTTRAQPIIEKFRESGLRRRLPYYAAITVLVVLVIAYIDGGEEPLHPITHRIATPVTAGAAQ